MSQRRHEETELQQAISQHRAGNISEAERLYRSVLCAQPHHGEANHNLGVLLMQKGILEQSFPFFKAALQADPLVGKYWLSQAKALAAVDRTQETLALVQQGRQRGLSGLAVDDLLAQGQPIADAQAHAAAAQHHQAGRLAKAVSLYRQALSREPDNADICDNLGHALVSLGELDQAIAAFYAALEIAPDNAEFWFNLGHALTICSEPDKAIAAFRQAVALRPNFADAHFRLGSLLSEDGAVAEGFAHYMRRAELIYGTDHPAEPEKPEPQHRRRHDREQREYLTGSRAAADAPVLPFHLADGGRLEGPAINPANASQALLTQWHETWPQLLVIDDFLTVEALEKLRRYCAGSTIWRRNYQAGYIGATPQDGFACPLMAQIAEEIRSVFPGILGMHQLQYLGAFKYDSELSTGTNLHVDRSAVNVNFYIAPDEANLDPRSGGMDIWDVAVPAGEDIRKYNGDESAAWEFLRRSNSKMTRIAHRANRALIFKSDLFHKTSDCHFRDGYLNKRINISLLFGHLGPPTK